MNSTLSLYLHIPFCKSKCPYCDFYSSKASEEEYQKYTDILKSKIIYWSEKSNKTISTIYFGGGTPSILGTQRLCSLLDTIKTNFIVNSNAEITLEINPESGKNLDFYKLRYCGFNRLSIGTQSAIQEELKALGRIHTADETKLTVQKAKQSGFHNISLDLMMGIPHQTIESLKRSIDFCNSCEVTHISSYILKIEKGTHFDIIKNKLDLPNEDYQAELYLSAVKELEKLGYKQYEISNFSKKGFESKHNINYWKCKEYIGIGPSAHSYFEGKRFYYNDNISDFENNITVYDCQGGTKEEYIMLSLRLKEGLSFAEYKSIFGSSLSDSIIKKVEKYAKLGYMNIDNNKINFTPKGYLVSNTILSDLIY